MGYANLQSYMEQSPYTFNEDVEYRILLYEIILELQEAEHFFDVYENIEEKLKVLLHAERVIVYKRGRHRRELSAHLRQGDGYRELRIDFSPASLAGFVAMTQKPICVPDVTDQEALQRIHPALTTDASCDEFVENGVKSCMAVPVLFGEILIGVLQLVNCDAEHCSPEEFKKLNVIATMMGDHFHHELGVTEGPFELLVKRGLVDRDQLEALAEQQSANHRTVAHMLMTELKIPRDLVVESLESFYQVPFCNANMNVRVPQKLIENINPKYIKHQGWIPIAENGREVTIVIDDPTDSERIMVIEQLFRGRTIKLLLMFAEEIADIAGAALLGEEDSAQSIEHLTDLAASEIDDVTVSTDEEKPSHDDRSSNVVRLLNKLITDAYTQGASDIHIQPGASKKPAAVMYRVDGVCRTVAHIPFKLVGHVTARLKVMCALDVTERRMPQDGKCSVRCRGQRIELRIAIIPNTHGQETAVIRLLSNCEAMHIYGLNLSDTNLDEIQRLAHAPHGLFLVVGPTGSGKTTTLHSVLGDINTGETIIWTVEDPVEITQPGLQQVNVNRKTGLTFARALRAFLRADPDVVLVGEMRDKETADIAIQASMTGHLVLSTLHTNSAVETINRLISMGVERFDLADSLLGILSQRLARTVCQHCASDYVPENEEYLFIHKCAGEEGFEEIPDPDDLGLKIGLGCPQCNNTGYRGRIGVHELLSVSPGIRELIATGAPSRDILSQSRSDGMPSFRRDALDKLLSGAIDYREFRKTVAFLK